MYRRGWMRLPKLDYARPDRAPGDPDFDRPQYRREDWAFLWILLDHRRHGLCARSGAAGVARRTRRTSGTRAGGRRSGALLAEGMRAAGLERARRRRCCGTGLWWFHGLLALALHRADSLHQGQAHLHGGGLAHGARSAGRAAPAARARAGRARAARNSSPISTGSSC